ncbi:MAG: hypothetical protein JW909_09850 [Planctomycetes bacterium]|nr:hypothetical protein [Planctomycetota bacterium]
MDARENALRIIRFDSPERIVGGLPASPCNYFGVNHEPFEGPGGHDSPVGTRWFDIWGVGWHRELEGVMGYAQVHPLADLSRIDSYPWPDPDDPRLVSQVYDLAENAGRNNTFLTGSHRETLWEKSYNLVGMDRLMLAFYDAPAAVREILHRVMDFQLGIARHYAEVGVEVAGFGDDLGGQNGLLFSPDILHEFFVPEYRRLFSFYKEKGVIITFHSCGYVEPILDVFMDLGVDVLNPVQATANDLDAVRLKTRGKMALQGGVSTHRIMTCSIEDIVAETRFRLWQLGRDGGYFCGPDQGMPFPEKSIQAVRDTVEEYGVYPIQPPPTHPSACGPLPAGN